MASPTTRTIEREVYIDAPPMAVEEALRPSPWRDALTVAPEGAGARVHIVASADPASIAGELETAILDAVCGVKRRLESI